MGKESLEVLSRFTDSKLEVKDIENWLMLTYDIPHTPEGDKARQRFLMEAAAIGAVRHTDSVYLMPWSPAAEVIALELAKTEGGKVIAWANCKPLNEQQDVLKRYDQALKQQIKDVEERLDRMAWYASKYQQKRLIQMQPKTERLLDNLEHSIARRDSEYLATLYEIQKTRYANIMA